MTSNAFSLNQPWARVKVEGQLEVEGRVLKLPCRLNEVIELDRVVETSQVRKAGDSVDALVLANLCFEHATNCNGQAVFVWPSVIPRHVCVQTKLPFLKVILAVRVP